MTGGRGGLVNPELFDQRPVPSLAWKDREIGLGVRTMGVLTRTAQHCALWNPKIARTAERQSTNSGAGLAC